VAREGGGPKWAREPAGTPEVRWDGNPPRFGSPRAVSAVRRMRGGTYLCTERGAWGRGYSASMFCNLVSPQGGQELVEETVKRLKELHAGA